MLTGAERAAIASIGLAGANASQVIAGCFRAASGSEILVNQIRYGTVGDESIVVTRLPDRDGDQRWELHCHGGAAAAAQILADLAAAGVTIVDHDVWLARDGKTLLQCEAIDVLARTVTARTAAIALDQARGAVEDFVDQSLATLRNADSKSIEIVKSQAVHILRFENIGLHLAAPWRVVLAGKPNVGKSSLVNALVGYRRSITFDQPGTTRDVLHADAVIDGWPIRLSDTAGIRHDATDKIESEGIDRAQAVIGHADLVVWVEDVRDWKPVNALPSMLTGKSCLQVVNKVDLAAAQTQRSANLPVMTSAIRDGGIETLRHAILLKLVPCSPSPGDAVPINPRQVDCITLIKAARSVFEIEAILHNLKGKSMAAP